MTTGTAVTTYDKEWADAAQQAAASEPLTGGSFLSIRGGILSFQDTPMPGNQACVIVVDSIRENTFYNDRYVEGEINPPRCYAFGRTDDEMAPHPSMQVDLTWFQPQAETCAICPKNQFGSADVGRGKACQNRRRIALLPAGFYVPKAGSRDFELQLFDDPKHYATADLAYLKLPVLSVKPWSAYVKEVAELHKRPPHGVLTRLYVVPDQKAQYKVQFENIGLIPDELAPILLKRAQQAHDGLVQGYAPPSED